MSEEDDSIEVETLKIVFTQKNINYINIGDKRRKSRRNRKNHRR